MIEANSAPLRIFVAGADTELGREVVQHLIQRGHHLTAQVKNAQPANSLLKLNTPSVVVDPTNTEAMTRAFQTAQPEVVLNLIPQKPNTLLHDGHAWDNFERTLTTTTTALLTAAKTVPLKLLVHTSYAFLYGNNPATTEESFLQPPNYPAFASAVQAEKMVAESKIPLCLLRMGFLYGPQSRDLESYKQSFNLFRPYYAGPQHNRANFLHYTDAASALALVAENQTTNQIFNLVDGSPTSFGDFIDTFAHYLGRLKPFHIPPWAAPLAELITIRPAQVTLLDLTTLVSSAKFSSQLGWEPLYPSYREGLAQVVRNWKERATS